MDGQWYPAVVQSLDLTAPNAVKWDAGTPGAKRNPKTGSSPAQAVRAKPGSTAPAPTKAATPPAKTPAPPDPTKVVKAAAAAVPAAQKVAADVLGTDNPLAAVLPPRS
jgi:hypothetical protein